MFHYAKWLLAAGCACSLAVPVMAEDAPTFDVGFELTGVTDYLDSGLTNSDHKPSGSIKITPSYGIFYGELSSTTIDHGAAAPKLETKLAVGMTPEFGALSVDFNLARRIRLDAPRDDRWLPYVTGTYTFNDNFSASLGGGYYIYDHPSQTDVWELYAATTFTYDSGASLLTELYWEPDSDGANNAYYALYGTLTVPFLEKFEAVGKIGYEGYEDKVSTPPYTWYEARLNYNMNDNVVLGVAYHGNTLSKAECGLQAYTDCDHAVFGSITLKGNLSDLSK